MPGLCWSTGVGHGPFCAASLLDAHDVSDLCIGKPALRWLPPSSTVADAIVGLEGGGWDAAAVAVWEGSKGQAVAGRVCMADVLLFLCDGGNLASPAAALQATLSDLLLAAGDGAPTVRHIEPDASGLEAVDALLDGGAHSLVVHIRDRRRAADGELYLCWLTLEDLARFFLGSIALFSPTASLSVSDLGIVRPATLAVAAGDSALSAVPLLRTALATHASVAVISSGILSPRRIVGEISPSTLCSCDASSAAAAIAALSARELMAFFDWPDATIHAVRSRLRRRNLLGMLDPSFPSSSSSSSSSSSLCATSSSEDEDDEKAGKDDDTSRQPQGKQHRVHLHLHAARRTAIMAGRRRAAEEPVACHRGSSLVAVMVQAITHRVTQVWVVDDDNELVGVVGFLDVLRVLHRHLIGFDLHHGLIWEILIRASYKDCGNFDLLFYVETELFALEFIGSLETENVSSGE